MRFFKLKTTLNLSQKLQIEMEWWRKVMDKNLKISKILRIKIILINWVRINSAKPKTYPTQKWYIFNGPRGKITGNATKERGEPQSIKSNHCFIENCWWKKLFVIRSPVSNSIRQARKSENSWQKKTLKGKRQRHSISRSIRCQSFETFENISCLQI